MTALSGWENFYVIVGSSAGALIGLQFVVLTLIADLPATGSDPQAGHTFASPTVVHFAVVLLLSAVISAPWDAVGLVAGVWGLTGLGGAGYGLIVARRMRSQSAYKAVAEDWLFHVLLPLAGYLMLIVAAGLAYAWPRPGLFVTAGAVLTLLFTGIHNAWDAVMYHVFVRRRQRQDDEPRPRDR